MLILFRADTCPPVFPTGSDFRSSFLFPTRRSQKIRQGSTMRLRSPTPISLLRAGPPSRRDLASDTRTPHFRSSSTSCRSPFSTLLLRSRSIFHVPPFLPQPPTFRRSYTFARRSIPEPIIVLVFLPERPTCVSRPGPISSPGAARSLRSSDSQAVTRED